MSRRSLRFGRKRKGLSELIGALFILVLLAVSFGFTLTMFTSFKTYQTAVDTRAAYNSAKLREQMSIDKVVFGASTPYNPHNLLSASNVSSTQGAKAYPISNMNFTSNADGWVFTRVYLQTGTVGASGNFDPVTSVGSPSGPGSIYSDFTFNAQSSSTVEAKMNWTAQFTLTPEQLSAMNGTASPATSTIGFALGQTLYAANQYCSGTNKEPTISVFFQDAESLSTVTVVAGVPAAVQWSQTSYGFPGGLSAQHSFFSGSGKSGTYNYIIESDVCLKGQQSSTPSVTIYFDDSGVVLNLQNYWSSTFCPAFDISQSPLSIQDLTFSVTTSYTKPVTQTVYLWDYAQGSLVQVDLASVGSTAVTRFIDLGGLVGGASEVQRFVETTSTTPSIPGCPGTLISSRGDWVIMKVYSVGSAQYTWKLSADVLTAFYTDTSEFSVQVTNSATTPLHLVSLWILGSTGTAHFDSTFCEANCNYFDEWVAPGQTVSFTVPYSWTPGQYTIELVSDRGNVFTITANTA